MLNMNFTDRVVIDTAAQPWQPSPMPGVSRKPLAREDAERGHATSIVRYEPGARFSEHGPLRRIHRRTRPLPGGHLDPQSAHERAQPVGREGDGVVGEDGASGVMGS